MFESYTIASCRWFVTAHYGAPIRANDKQGCPFPPSAYGLTGRVAVKTGKDFPKNPLGNPQRKCFHFTLFSPFCQLAHASPAKD